MDFTLAGHQLELRDLAAAIFGDVTTERVKQAEAEGLDRRLWEDLTRANLLGVTIPEADGGLGYGMVEAALVLEQQGRAVAPAPLAPALVAATVLPEERRAAVAAGATAAWAIVEPAGADAFSPATTFSDGALRGTKIAVEVARAPSLVVTTASGLALTDGGAVAVTEELGTAPLRRDTVRFDGVAAEPLAGTVDRLVQAATIAVCALQLGVVDRALQMTAEYTSGRQQFGRPLGSFQAVQQRAADGYVDVQAMRWTTYLAAWRFDAGLDCSDAVNVAKFWAAEAGQRVVSAAQHLHGGIGVDADYPLHRHTLWAKVLEHDLGGAGPSLARIGAAIAAGDHESAL